MTLLYCVQLAWRQLVHRRSRLLAALLGVAFAVLLMFMQLGFRSALLAAEPVSCYPGFLSVVYLPAS